MGDPRRCMRPVEVPICCEQSGDRNLFSLRSYKSIIMSRITMLTHGHPTAYRVYSQSSYFSLQSITSQMTKLLDIPVAQIFGEIVGCDMLSCCWGSLALVL